MPLYCTVTILWRSVHVAQSMLQEVQRRIAEVAYRGGQGVFAHPPKVDKEETSPSSPWFKPKEVTIRSHKSCIAETSCLATSNVGSAFTFPQPTNQYYTRDHSSGDRPCKFGITHPCCFNARAF